MRERERELQNCRIEGGIQGQGIDIVLVLIMRDRMERLVILPFSVGCMSEASVAVGVPQPRKSRSFTNSTREEEGEGGMVHVPKPNNNNVSTGFNKLVKGFKSLSQMFGEKEDELEEEEAEREMQIGGPTDVQHVTHIGWDGHAITANPGALTSAWDLLSLSLHHYRPAPQ